MKLHLVRKDKYAHQDRCLQIPLLNEETVMLLFVSQQRIYKKR